jgi:hypothetical protein
MRYLIAIIVCLFYYSINVFAIDVDLNEFIVNGCTDIAACNYDPLADTDDGTCSYDDSDGDGVCDDDEILGCTTAVACNYNSAATDHVEALCDYTSCYVFGCLNTFACNYNPLADYDDGTCDFTTCAGCTDVLACDYDPTATISETCSDFSSCYGCLDSEADNYDPTATIDNGNCVYYGCTISVACNYEPNATVNNGTCEFTSCAGCTTPSACNYDPTWTYHNPSTCIFPDTGYDCDGVCLLDTDGDGICDVLGIPGCTDPEAINYDPNAEDDNGTCTYPFPGCMDGFACNFIWLATVDDGTCEFISCVGCLSPEACNYDATAAVHDPSACEFPEFGYDCDGSCQCSCLCDYGYEDGDGICDVLCIPGCTDPEAINYDPTAEDDNGTCTYPVPGCMDATACNYNIDVDVDDGSCAVNDECGICAGSGIPEGDCDCDGNVLDPCGVCGGDGVDEDCDGICDSIDDCIATCEDFFNPCGPLGCTDPENPCYNPISNEDDGSCCVGGCTISVACNYNPDAEYLLPGACEFSTCAGCMDAEACNYDETATLPINITCTYAEPNEDCDGNCLDDVYGIYDGCPIFGCTDPVNPSYNPSANVSDPEACLVAGCLIPFACNYDADADYIDVSLCEFASCIGCTDPDACNYLPDATLSSAALCTFPTNPFRDCDGNCYDDSDGDDICGPEIAGCTDLAAINYNPFATDDDGTCIILVGGCVIPFACNYDPDADYYLAGSCDFSCL